MTQQQSSSQGRPPRQQELPLASSLPPQSQQPDGCTSWSEWIYLIFAILVTIPLLYLFGPIILFSQAIARWVGRAFWQDEKDARIKGVWEAAWLYLLLYLPIALLHSQLEAVWTWCFALLSSWIHLPLLTWIAAPALSPFLTPQTLLYRWFLSIPLTYLWAAIWMTTDEREAVSYTRVLLPEEAAQLQAAKDAEAKKTARKSRTSTQAQAQTQKTRQATTRKPRTTRTKQSATNEPQATSDAKATGQQIPKPDSLWGEVNWEQVPDTNPLKQAALQAKKTSPAAPKPTPQPPPEPPQPSPKKDDYDWDSGDGSLSL